MVNGSIMQEVAWTPVQLNLEASQVANFSEVSLQMIWGVNQQVGCATHLCNGFYTTVCL